MSYVFISYSTKNQSTADAVYKLLNDVGIEVWMAPNNIPAGSQYAQVIDRAIEDCSCFILLLSNDAQNSVWVSKEVELAVHYHKTIIPVQLEELTLNDEFETYISTNQIITMQKIDKDIICSHTEAKEVKNIRLTVWSPVNTDVFLNDKHHLILKIDCNSGFNYARTSINISQSFNLIFVARGFEKTIPFDIDSIGDQLEYRLNTILSEKEIYDSYSREEAIEQIDIEPTGYAFEQLSQKGTIEDVDLLIKVIKNLAKRNGFSNDYLTAMCAYALGKLALKFDRMDDIAFIVDIYESYEAKSSYGYMFKSIISNLK